jgi:Ca-activated chloride channel homolog
VSFQEPILLLTLLLIPIGLAGWVAWRRRRPASSVPFPDVDVLAASAPAPRLRRHAPLVLLLLALTGLAFALARPQVSHAVARKRATIMLALDVSGSMAADDIAPYRLRAAQDAAERFADKVPATYEVGLVSFSGGANLLLPPTTDRVALRNAIETLVPDGATAIGDAVLTSLQALRDREGGTAKLDAARILLLSDGANTTGASPEAAASAARRAGVPVYTVALGTPDGTLPNGQTVPPDPQGLADLAHRTGGKSYTSTDAGSVSSVYQKLGGLVGTETVEQEVTAWAAGLAALFLVAAGAAAWRFGTRIP